MDETQMPEEIDASDILNWLNIIETKIASAFSRIKAEPERSYLSVKNASVHSDLSQKTLRRFISEGRLKSYRPARGKILIKKKELDALIEQSTEKIRRGRGIRH